MNKQPLSAQAKAPKPKRMSPPSRVSMKPSEEDLAKARKAAKPIPNATAPAAAKHPEAVKHVEHVTVVGSAPRPRNRMGNPNWVKGVGGNPAGSKPGQKATITEAKLKFLALNGQTPLEFLTAVYQDRLYDQYESEVIDEARGLAHVYPKLHPVTGEILAKKIPVKLEQRIAAATSAAPYVHRKKPIGIDGGEGKPLSFVSATQLAKLSDAELDKLLQILGKLGVAGEFEGGQREAYTLGDDK